MWYLFYILYVHYDKKTLVINCKHCINCLNVGVACRNKVPFMRFIIHNIMCKIIGIQLGEWWFGNVHEQ